MIEQHPLDNRAIMQEPTRVLTPAQRVTLQTLRRVLISALTLIEELLKS